MMLYNFINSSIYYWRFFDCVNVGNRFFFPSNNSSNIMANKGTIDKAQNIHHSVKKMNGIKIISIRGLFLTLILTIINQGTLSTLRGMILKWRTPSLIGGVYTLNADIEYDGAFPHRACIGLA